MQPPSPQDDKRRSGPQPGGSMQSWYRMTGAGFEFVVAVLLFGGIGWFIDERIGTSPWLTLAGVGLGFVVGMFILIRLANRMFRE